MMDSSLESLSGLGSDFGGWVANNPGTAMRILGTGVNMFAPQGSGVGNALMVGGDIANIGSAAGGGVTRNAGTAAPSFGVGPDADLGNAPTTSGTLPDYTTARTAASNKLAAETPTVGKSLETGLQDMDRIRQQQLANAAALRQMFGNQGATPPPLQVTGGRAGATSPVSLPNSAQLIAQMLSAKPVGFTGFGG